MSIDRAAQQARVYVSYSRKDFAVVEQSQSALEAAGFEVWRDHDIITGGVDWRVSLGRILETSDVVVHVVSPASAASDVVTWEIQAARELGKRIVRFAMTEGGDPNSLSIALVSELNSLG